MQIIDDPNAGGFLRSLGGRIGQGLGSQIPKEVDRIRLSEGLRKFGNQPASQNLGDNLANLYAIPGATEHPEVINTLLPFVQAQAAARSIGQKGKGEQVVKPMPEGKEGEEPLSRRLINTPEANEQRGRDRYLAEPFRFKTPQDAIAYEQQAAEQQEANVSKARAYVDKDIEDFLQKKGNEVYRDIAGSVGDKFRSKAEEAVIRGAMTPQEAGRKYGKEALELAKATANVRNIGTGRWNPFSPSADVKNDTIKRYVEQMAKFGSREEAKNELMTTLNISEPTAAAFAYPISKEIQSAVKSLPNLPERFSVDRLLAKTDKNEDAFAKKVVKNLKPTDSLMAIAEHAMNKSYDGRSIMKKIEAEVIKQGKQLSEDQKKELASPENFIRTLGDVYYKTFFEGS